MLLRGETQTPMLEDTLVAGGPAVKRVFEEVRRYEDLLNSIPNVSGEEKVAIINSLDAQWPYYGETLRVTGNIFLGQRLDETAGEECDTQTVGRDQASYQLNTIFVEDMPLKSYGFNYLERPVRVGGEVVGNESTIGLYFYVRDDQINPNMLLTHYVRVSAIAGVDDVIIEYPDIPGDDLLPQLNYFFPEVADNIDTALLNATDEVDAMERLGKVVVKLNHDITPEAIGVLARYVESVVDFDELVPYDIAFTGLLYKVDDDNSPDKLTMVKIDNAVSAWAYPKSIEVLPSTRIRENKVSLDYINQIFALRLKLLSKEGDDEKSSTLVIPLTDDFVMTSVRKTFYADQQP